MTNSAFTFLPSSMNKSMYKLVCNLVFSVLLCLVSSELMAQSFGNIQDPITAHYSQTMIAHNPAYSSGTDFGEFHFSGQNLANTFDTLSDKSFILAFQSPNSNFPGGLGGQLVYVYSAFNARIINLQINFSYKVVESETQILSVGGSLGGGMRETLIGQFPTSGSPAIATRFYPDLNAGIWYTNYKLFLGVGAAHITRPRLEYTPSIVSIINDVYYLSGGYKFEIEGIEIIPSFMGRFRNTSDFLSDVQVNANYENKFGLGVGYRTDLRRNPIIINPSVQQAPRFRQVLATGSVGIKEFTIFATYSRTLSQFGIAPDNFEMTLSYRFKS
ncbi:MAG: type IX secretion system PorP/SprF family membrane protein [Limisphaerales bacterium]|jgi:type IX secretion system PorP/SprF family membrane protein